MGGVPWLDVSFPVEGELLAQKEVFRTKGGAGAQAEEEVPQAIDHECQ